MASQKNACERSGKPTRTILVVAQALVGDLGRTTPEDHEEEQQEDP